MIKVTVKVDLEPLRRFNTELSRDLRGSGSGHIRAALKQWAVRYRSFVQERFDTFSKGGGDWPPLSPRTIAGRRKGRGSRRFAKGAVAILRDTGTLFGALSPTFTGKPGQLQEDIPFGVRVGYGGPHRYPSGGRATIADIAAFHQEGNSRLPKREIIVTPSERVLDQMAADMDRAIGRTIRSTGNA